MQRTPKLRRALGLASTLSRRAGLAAVLAAPLAAVAIAQEPSAPTSGCTLKNRVYTCNWLAFHRRFEDAQTVAVEAEPLDHFSLHQLRELARSRGKTVAAPGQPADLIFLLSPVDTGGITIGPGDKPLGTLRIYAPGEGTARGELLWAETYTGQPDHPWPATVHTLIDQFQSRFNQR